MESEGNPEIITREPSNEKVLDLGILQKIFAVLLPETWAITMTIVVWIIFNLSDGCGDVGLAFSL